MAKKNTDKSNENNLSTAEIVSALVEEHGLSTYKANKVIDSIADLITTALKDGKKVRLRGIGIFDTKNHEEMERYSPSTKTYVTVPEHKTVSFRASSALKTKVNRKD